LIEIFRKNDLFIKVGDNMAKKVLVVDPIHERGITLLKKEVKIVMAKGTSLEALSEQVDDINGIIVRDTKLPKDIIKKANKLKVIGAHGSGVDNIDLTFV